MTKEIWKSIDGFEGCYEVSNTGKVRSLDRTVNHSRGSYAIKRGKILKQVLNNRYLNVSLSNLNKKSPYNIHRLVAKAFISNPENKPEVNHKDGNKLNNQVDNLEWATSSENRQHAFDTGLQNNPNGEKCVHSKLKESEAKDILISDLPYKELAKKYSISLSTIYDIKCGRSWACLLSLLLFLTFNANAQTYAIKVDILDSLIFETIRGRACATVSRLQAKELEAQGKELLQTGATLKTSLNALTASENESKNLRVALADTEKLSKEREKKAKKKAFKFGMAVGIGLGVIGLLL